MIGATPMVLVVNPSKVQATNSKEFIALLKSKPGALNFASGGNGTILHLATELFLEQAGVTAKHIPYKGVGPMVTDLIGGQVEFGTAALPSVQSHIKSGALRADRRARRRSARRLRRTFPPSSSRGCRTSWWMPGSRSSGRRA